MPNSSQGDRTELVEQIRNRPVQGRRCCGEGHEQFLSDEWNRGYYACGRLKAQGGKRMGRGPDWNKNRGTLPVVREATLMSGSLRDKLNLFDPNLPLERARTIPSFWYADPEIYAAECRFLFGRTW